MTRLIQLSVLAFLCIIFTVSAGKKVLLSSVQTLTLHSNKFTTGRRSSPIPQLKCIDREKICSNLPSTVQCYNRGTDGIDVQWKCEAQLPKSTQFDTLQVQCEGYDYPDDPYILAGSCGLTYSLKSAGSGHSHKSRSSSHKTHHSGDDKSILSPLAIVVIIIVCCLAIYFFFLAPSSTTTGQHRSTPTAPPPPTYTAGDDDYDAPPPYSEAGSDAPQYGFRPEFTGTGGGKTYERRSYGQQQQQQQQQQRYNSSPGADAADSSSSGSGPGFWTGLGVGGLAGYLFGSSGSRGGGYSEGYGGGYSGGYGGGGYHRDSRSSYEPCPPSSSSSSSADSEPVTRSGYATTRRR